MTNTEYDRLVKVLEDAYVEGCSLGNVLTDAYVAGRKSGYRDGLIDSALDVDEVASRIEMLFGSDDEEMGAHPIS